MSSDLSAHDGDHTANTHPTLRGLELLCALSLLMIVAITVIDVIGRYVVAKPLWGASEYIQFAMALTIFSGLPLITRSREHVSVDILERLAPPWDRLKLLLVDSASLVTVLILARQLLVQAKDYWQVGTTTTVLTMPMAPLAAVMGVLAILTAVILVQLLWRTASGKAAS